MIIEELVALLGFKLDGEDAVKRFRGHLEGVREKLTTVVAVAKGVAVGALAGVAGGMIAAGKGAISTGIQFENLGIVLETIEGSSEKAKASLDWVAKFAAKTPYDLAGVSEAFVQLRAYGMDPMNGMLTALGDASAAMNKPLSQAVEAIADAARGEMERLKEFGITSEKVGENVVLSWDQDGKTLTKTVKKNSQELQKAVVDIFGARFHGAMERLSFSLSGMFSNIGDMWTGFQQKINNAGWYAWVKAQTKEMLDWFNALDADGSLDRWAGIISRSLVSVGNALKNAGRLVWDFVKQFNELPDSVKTGAAALGGILFAAFFPMITALGGLILVLDDVWTYMNGGESVTGDFVGWLKEIGGVSDDTAEKVTALATALGLLAVARPVGALKVIWWVIRGLRLAIVGVVGAIGGIPAAIAGVIAGIIIFRDGLGSVFDWLREKMPYFSAFFWTLEYLVNLVGNGVKIVSDVFWGILGLIGDFFGLIKIGNADGTLLDKGFVESVASKWEMLHGVISAVGGAFSSLIGWARSAGEAIGDVLSKIPGVSAIGGMAGSAVGWMGKQGWFDGMSKIYNGGTASPVTNPGPLLSPGASTVNNTVTSNVNAPVTVTMTGTNASPQAVGEATSEALSRRLAGTLPAGHRGRGDL